MLKIPKTVMVTPPTAVKIIDETPYCWTILTYNSNQDLNLKGYLNSHPLLYIFIPETFLTKKLELLKFIYCSIKKR
jgi:hypothetical protein